MSTVGPRGSSARKGTRSGAGSPAAYLRERADVRHAIRVALGLLVPGLCLIAVGRPELMLYVVFGSFTGMYGRLEPWKDRLRHQFHGAGMIVTGVATGVALAHNRASAATVVICVTAFATIASVVTDWLRLRPGGPFFGIFALGATATVGADLVSWWHAVVLCAGTAAFAMLLGVVVSVTRGGGGPASSPRTWAGSVRSRVTQRPVSWRRGLPAGSGTHAFRYAVATAGAGLAGLLLGVDHANWAMASAAVPLAVVVGGERLELRAVLHRALHRLTGTGVGLVVTAVLLWPRPGAVVLAVAVMVLLFPTELFMSRHYGVALGFFTPVIMIMTELAEPTSPLTMIVARGVDTAIGVAAGVASAALIPGRVRGQAQAGPGPG
jgi:hypothetical protein